MKLIDWLDQKNLLNENKLVVKENQQISPTSLERMGQSYNSDLNKFTNEGLIFN